MASRAKSISGNSINIVSQKLKDYAQLVKFRLTATVVFSAVMAYLIAASGEIAWLEVVILSIGGFLVTGSANALNQVLEREFDTKMKRTADRPVATGRMKVSEAVMSAGIMGLAGITFLAVFNPWTSFFGMIALLSYAFVYTPLKRVSPIAIPVGALPGALPAMIGCVAAQGELTTLAFTFFALQFLWQFPHFAAIGWLGFEDYKKAGFRFVTGQSKSAGIYSMVYALLLVPIGLMPFIIGMTGLTSAIIVSVLAVGYAWFGWNLFQKNNRKAALALMFSSFFYLPLTLIILFIDKI